MNTPFDIQINLSSAATDDRFISEKLAAICKLQTEETLRVKSITGTLVLQIKGMLVEQKKEIDTFQIVTTGQTLLKGNRYEFPFSFNKNNDTESYKGKNVSFIYSLQLSIHLHEEDYDKVKRGVFKKVKTLFTGDKSLKHIEYLELNSNQKEYYLQDFQGEMKAKLPIRETIISTIILALLFGGIAYYGIFGTGQFSFSPNLIFVGIGSLIGAGLIQVLISKFFLTSFSGQMEMFLDQEDRAHIGCKIEHSHNWKFLQAPTLYYEVIEKVTDRRGTSTSVRREAIYRSQKQIVNIREANKAYKFPFPEKKNISTLKLGDATIYWEMIVEAKTKWGFRIKYTGNFEVIKASGKN